MNTPGDAAKAPRYFLVLPAAGSGQRMQSSLPKQYHTIGGVTLLQLTLERVAADPLFTKVVIALAADDDRWIEIKGRLSPGLKDKLVTVTGGEERFQSVANALAAIADVAAADDWVLVHDVVRPCVRSSDIKNLVESLASSTSGGLLAVPVRDTLKEGSNDLNVVRTLDRKMLWLAATPQMFRYGVLAQALRSVANNGWHITDEASAVEALGLPVTLVEGRADNIKVTYPEDLEFVAAILQAEAGISNISQVES